jgi:CMP-N-acetylneuraminic acid synthetase
MRLRVPGIVPARGGSRGVPRKNVRLLYTKPLLVYTAELALAIGVFVVFTEAEPNGSWYP